MNDGLFARHRRALSASATASASPPSRSACWSAITPSIAARAPRSTPDKKKRLAAIVERLAALGTAFSQNVLADEQSYTMELDGEADLAGLPDFVREAAAAAADRARHERQARHHPAALQRRAVPAVLVAARSSREGVPRLDRARRQRRQDRQQGASSPRSWRCAIERAKLLGYPTFAQYRLDDAMAKTPEAVRGLAGKGLEAGAQGRARRPRRPAGADRRGGRQLQARAVGLALLRREASRAALRLRGVRGQAVLPARPRDRGGVLRRAEAVRADVPSGRGAGLASRRARPGRCAAPTAATSASSTAIISRARASMAAPGWAPCATRRSSPATSARSCST